MAHDTFIVKAIKENDIYDIGSDLKKGYELEPKISPFSNTIFLSFAN